MTGKENVFKKMSRTTFQLDITHFHQYCITNKVAPSVASSTNKQTPEDQTYFRK
jgi:hypothetical protein